MRLSIPSQSPAALLVAAALLFFSGAAALAQANGAHQPVQAQAAPVDSAAKGDHLVQVGKHFMWKSQVEKMHPELKDKAVPVSKANKNDFQIIVDKKPVWASTLRRDPNAKTRPPAHDKACRDYVVQAGKKTAWAADCPMGKHEKGAKPLCCVAPVSTSAKLPHCCQ